MKKIYYILSIFLTLLGYSHMAAAEEYDLGQISINMTGLLSHFNSGIEVIFFALGAGLVCGSLLLYRRHRQNPAEVRLAQAVLLGVCGLAIFVLPFITGKSDGGQILTQGSSYSQLG